MNMIMSIQTIVSLVFAIVVGGLLFPNSALAEIPPIDTVEVEHTETATFALG